MDCQYPRDLLQPESKKNIMFDSCSLTLLFFASAIVLLYHSLTRLLLTLHFLAATVSHFTSTICSLCFFCAAGHSLRATRRDNHQL